MPHEAYSLTKTGSLLQNALTMARLSDAVYEKSIAKTKAELSGDFPNIESLRFGETQGVIVGNDKHVAVVFRGTDEPRDWIDNVNYKQVERKGFAGPIHLGFAKQLYTSGCWDKVLTTVKKFRDNKQTLWVSGHSLGGALATLAAQELVLAKLTPRMAFTFGSPRVMHPDAAAEYRPNLARFVNDQDIVPHCPSMGIFNRYYHVGGLVFFLPSGRISKNTNIWNLAKNKIAKIALFGAGSLASEAIGDHAIDHYIGNIRKNLH